MENRALKGKRCVVNGAAIAECHFCFDVLLLFVRSQENRQLHITQNTFRFEISFAYYVHSEVRTLLRRVIFVVRFPMPRDNVLRALHYTT